MAIKESATIINAVVSFNSALVNVPYSAIDAIVTIEMVITVSGYLNFKARPPFVIL